MDLGHINGPENLSILNMYFIEALIMVLVSSKLKVWLPYNKTFTNTSSVRFEILTIFLTKSKRVWQDCIKCRQCRKKWIFNSTSTLQEHNRFRPFKGEACNCMHMHPHTHVKAFRRVIDATRNETFGYTFFLHNFLCLIKICCFIIRA